MILALCHTVKLPVPCVMELLESRRCITSDRYVFWLNCARAFPSKSLSFTFCLHMRLGLAGLPFKPVSSSLHTAKTMTRRVTAPDTFLCSDWLSVCRSVQHNTSSSQNSDQTVKLVIYESRFCHCTAYFLVKCLAVI